MTAKKTTLWAQITAAVWVAGWSAYWFIRTPESITAKNIIITGIALVVCFFPVVFSMGVDKLKELIKSYKLPGSGGEN